METNQTSITGPKIAPTRDDEEPDDDGQAQRDDEVLEPRRRDREALHRAEHRDGRGDDAVAVEERRPEEPEHEQELAPPPCLLPADEREQGEDAALAAVVGPHHEGEVLHDHDAHERPEHQRQHAEDVLGGGRHAVGPGEALLERVQRARADVAVDHPERAEGEPRQSGAARRAVAAGVDDP
jgi:hypothetical protein